MNSYYKYLNKIEVKVQPSCLITIWRWKPSTLFEAIKICFIPPNLKLKFLHRQTYNFQHQEHCQCLSSPVSHRTITFSTCAPPPTWKPHLLLLLLLNHLKPCKPDDQLKQTTCLVSTSTPLLEIVHFCWTVRLPNLLMLLYGCLVPAKTFN